MRNCWVEFLNEQRGNKYLQDLGGSFVLQGGGGVFFAFQSHQIRILFEFFALEDDLHDWCLNFDQGLEHFFAFKQKHLH